MVIAKRQNAKAVCPMGSGAGFGGISHVNAGRFSSEDVVMEAFPEEFHRDVVKVARDSKEPWIKVAVDLGISPATLCNRWRQVNIETRPQNTL